MAKHKTEKQRFIILDAAAEVFRKEGFERTTMDAIRQHIGISKATIYNYFPSKADLFLEVMLISMEKNTTQALIQIKKNSGQFTSDLKKFAIDLISTIYSTDMLAIRRLIISDPNFSNMGEILYQRGPQQFQLQMISILQSAITEGYLKPSDVRIMEIQLCALIESEFIQILLFGLKTEITSDWITAAANRAIDTFMIIYGK